MSWRSSGRSRTDADRSLGEPEVRAAGGVIWKVLDGDVVVALVHRPKYRDWTFPKGKVEPGETDEQTAHREVLEETGLDCVLGRELPSVSYLDAKRRHKLVRYWEMTIASGSFRANDEVDELRWVSIADARRRLTHAHDVDVLDAFARLAGG
jgi:8-oxo-dGTP diphosphatase